MEGIVSDERLVTCVKRLKDRTLKNVYEQRAQTTEAPVLLEAVDQAALQQVSQALAKLEGLVPDGANIFNQAIEAAKTDLGNYLKGGVKQFFKNLVGDPVLKATSFANAVRAGFAAFPTVSKLYLPKGAENEQQRSVMELIPQDKQQQFVQAMVKAFTPESKVDISQLFKGNSMPYVQNLQAAVQELFQNVAPNGFFKLSQQAAATPPPAVQQAQNSQQAGQPPQAAQNQAGPTPAAGAGNAPTTGSQPTQAANATGSTAATAPTKAATPPTAQKKLGPKDTDRIDNISYFLASQTGVDKAAAQKIIAKLAELNGLTDIPTPNKPSNKLAGNAPPATAPAPAKAP